LPLTRIVTTNTALDALPAAFVERLKREIDDEP